MGRYEVKNPLTPEGRNQINSMFEELYKEYTGAGINAKDAREKAVQAVADSILAKDIAETTRQEMLAIIREQTKNGDLAPEIAQARGGKQTLGDRFNSVDSQLAEKAPIEYVDMMMSSITDGSPKKLFYSIDALNEKYPYGTTGPMLVFDSSFTDGAHSFIWNEGLWIDVGADYTWRLGSLDISNGKPRPEFTTRMRNVEYTYLDEGIIGLTDYSNYKFMIFIFGQEDDDTFIGSSDWLTEDYAVQTPGYYRVLIAYQDDREILESEVNTLGSLLRIKREGSGWVDIGVYQSSVIPNKSIGLEKLGAGVLNTLFNATITGTDFTWRLGTLDTGNGKPVSGNVTRVRNVEYTHLNKGVIGLTNYSNYKFMVFMFSQDNDDSFIKASEWFTDDYIIQETGYYRVLVAYRDDKDIYEQEVNTLGSLLKIQRDGNENVATDLKKISNHVDNISNDLKKIVDSSVVADIDNINFKLGSGNTNDGSEVPSTTRVTSDYIYLQNAVVKFDPGDDKKYLVLYYDADMNYLNVKRWNTRSSWVIVEEPQYIRLLLAYTDDREIAESDIPNLKNMIVDINSYYFDDNRVSDGYYFRGERIAKIPVEEDALGYNDFIEQTWETLRTKYPNNIDRNVIIKDTSNTFDIYEYTYTPDNYEKTVFLSAGIHGDEYEAFWGLYYFMKYICEDSYKYNQLRDFKHNVRFIIIPVLNPWGVENRTRATSRVSNANNNYDIFHRNPEYESPAGASAFSENEALAVKLVADKYDADFDFYADFHTDPYDPQNGNYILINQLSSTMDVAKQLTIDEVAYLKDGFGFETIMKPNIVNINRRSSSFKYMEAVRGVPSAIIEVGTGEMFPIGSSESITLGVDWYTNIIVEMLRYDLREPEQLDKGMEKAILENRLTGYSNSVMENIPDDGLQVNINHVDFDEVNGTWANRAERGELTIQGLSKTPEGILFENGNIKLPENDYSNFTLVFKGVVNSEGVILSSEGDLKLAAVTNESGSTRFDIYNGVGDLVCSALKYGDVVEVGVKSLDGTLHLYVNGEPFNSITANHSTENQLFIGSNGDLTEPIGMSINSLKLYDRALSDAETGFVFKSFIEQ